MILINDLKVIMNKGVFLENEIYEMEHKDPIEIKTRRNELYIEKNKAINDVISFRIEYHKLSETFNNEIIRNITNRDSSRWARCGRWLRT